MSRDCLVARVLDEASGTLSRMLALQIDRAVAILDSPIEKAFSAALIANASVCPQLYGIHYCAAGDCPGAAVGQRYFCPGLSVFPQCNIQPYRADYLMLDVDNDNTVRRVTVVELDGHAFHEKTKLQAAHDKKRDRFFVSKGYHVIRYTGSEVWADPCAVAEQAVMLALGMADESVAS